MQYRISTLVAIFSASTALAYLDCGGGRAPPKTTVPGCPGYVDPATVVSTTTPTTTVYSTQHYTTVSPTTASYDAQETQVYNEDGQFTVYQDADGADGCYCRGYLCEYAIPGCVNLDTSSTITANPGWSTKSFDTAGYYSYAKTASAGGELSVDGYRIELPTGAPSAPVVSSVYGHSISSSSRTKSSTVTTGTVSSSVTVVTLATSTLSAQANSTFSTSSSTVPSSANITISSAAQTSITVADHNSASKISGMASLAALLVSGAAAIVLL